jgi:AraC-like DNA-binding protein
MTLATPHPDEAHQFLARMYATHEVRLKGRVDGFRFRFRDADLGDQGWSVMEHSHASVLSDIAPFGQVVIGRILDGSYSCRMGADEITVRRGEWILIDPDLPSDMTWSPGVRIAIARFDRATLDRLTAGLSEHDPDQPMRYPLSRVRSPQHARALDQLDLYVRSLLGNETTRSSTLIRGQTSRLVAAHLLEAFPIAPAGYGQQRGDRVGPASLRRALAFIDDHHDAEIGLPEIASAARVTPRALQQTFREYEHTTPGAYLRRARLDSAHRDLRQADPDAGITVSDIAARWGFTNPGRFAAAYRQVYGREPNHTLRDLTQPHRSGLVQPPGRRYGTMLSLRGGSPAHSAAGAVHRRPRPDNRQRLPGRPASRRWQRRAVSAVRPDAAGQATGTGRNPRPAAARRAWSPGTSPGMPPPVSARERGVPRACR